MNDSILGTPKPLNTKYKYLEIGHKTKPNVKTIPFSIKYVIV